MAKPLSLTTPQRRFRRLLRFARSSQPTRRLPKWCVWSVAVNLVAAGMLVGLLAHASLRPKSTSLKPAAISPAEARVSPAPTGDLAVGDLATVAQTHRQVEASPNTPDLGPRHRLSYQDWVALLEQEAIAVGQRQTTQLTVLMGDSISLWFPPALLPSDRSWLNQGISGEVTSGLLNRLDLIEDTEPDTILLMIGINDLIRGIREQTLLSNYRLIIEDLQQTHPDARIVVQSILPHAAEAATWEGADKFAEMSNDDIRELNQEIAAIAEDAEVDYLNLGPLFTDSGGKLRGELTTDGLHLNDDGYLVWATALQLYLTPSE
ncbi:MAG: SGNH/GDSL hydrolase family protein [Cyanobacteria bacterium P01_A01_bin.135]